MNKHDTSEQKTSMIHPNLFGSSQKKNEVEVFGGSPLLSAIQNLSCHT